MNQAFQSTRPQIVAGIIAAVTLLTPSVTQALDINNAHPSAESLYACWSPVAGAIRYDVKYSVFPNSNGMLRSGSTGQILIPTIESEVLIIPQRATFEIQDRKFVYVVNDSNKVVSTPITVASQNDGQNFVVTSGLTPGQRIAVEGVGSTLREGLTIQPVDAAAKAQQAAQQQQAQ